MTEKKTATAKRRISNFGALHLLTGCCLIGGGCGVCGGGPDFALRGDVRRLWEANRPRLLGIWRDPAGVPKAGGFSFENRRGAGRWIPAFGEIYFDGVPRPKPKAAWPSEAKKIWREILENLG